jgi:hypothetical protein
MVKTAISLSCAFRTQPRINAEIDADAQLDGIADDGQIK